MGKGMKAGKKPKQPKMGNAQQMAHGSVSVRFPQTEQNFMVSFASLIASDNAKASSSFIERMWRASLWAVLSPIPGRRASSLINLLSGFA